MFKGIYALRDIIFLLNVSLVFRQKLEHLNKMKMVAQREAEDFSKQVLKSL